MGLSMHLIQSTSLTKEMMAFIRNKTKWLHHNFSYTNGHRRCKKSISMNILMIFIAPVYLANWQSLEMKFYWKNVPDFCVVWDLCKKVWKEKGEMEKCDDITDMQLQSIHQSRWLTAAMMEKMAQKCFSLFFTNDYILNFQGIVLHIDWLQMY